MTTQTLNNKKQKEQLTNLNIRSKKIKGLILSMIMPGLGQFYNHQLSKGVFLFLSFTFSILIFSWIAINGPLQLLSIFVLIGFLLSLGIYILSLIDAYKNANAISGSGENQKIHIYLSILFFGYFFILQQVVDYTSDRILKFYSIPSESMNPNIVRGDFIFVSRDVNCMGCKRKIQRGDVATFVYPNDRTTTYIKRIIGLPNDEIQIKSNEIFVNCKSISRGEVQDLGNPELNKMLNDHMAFLEISDSGATYPVLWIKGESLKEDVFKVPPGQVFVLGDNRSHAVDSRIFGYVPLTDIVGVAKQVFISTVGFSRTFKVVEVN